MTDLNAEVYGRIWWDDTPGWAWYRDDSTTWSKWGHFNAFNEPVLADFSWVNQSSATSNSTNGPIIIQTAAPLAAGENVNMMLQATPATPYNLFMAFMPQVDPYNETSCGVVLRESSTNKFLFFRFMYNTASSIAKSDVVFSVDKYTNATTFNSNYVVNSAGFLRGMIIWFQIVDDGTNLSWYYSPDGINFNLITTQSRTNFLTSGPNQIGFAINSNNTSGAAGMTLLSWN